MTNQDRQAQRDADKKDALAVTNQALDAVRVANKGAALSRWQRHFLCQALGNIYNGVFGMARMSANLAIRPQGTYNDEALPEEPDIQHFSLADLQQVAADLASYPAPLRPRFITRD